MARIETRLNALEKHSLSSGRLPGGLFVCDGLPLEGKGCHCPGCEAAEAASLDPNRGRPILMQPGWAAGQEAERGKT